MSYTPTQWKAGDTITSTKLNKIEQRIAAGEPVFIVPIEYSDSDEYDYTTTMTCKEIYDAAMNGIVYGRIINIYDGYTYVLDYPLLEVDHNESTDGYEFYFYDIYNSKQLYFDAIGATVCPTGNQSSFGSSGSTSILTPIMVYGTITDNEIFLDRPWQTISQAYNDGQVLIVVGSERALILNIYAYPNAADHKYGLLAIINGNLVNFYAEAQNQCPATNGSGEISGVIQK